MQSLSRKRTVPVRTKSGELADLNPIRYRGYYYDTETGFYYLQSRYYDPALGRFINADSYTSTGQDYIGYNMFAYCNNNPVILQDNIGEFGWLSISLVGAAIGAVVSAATSVVTQYVTSGEVNWKSVGVAAVSGAVSGFLSASPLGLTGQRVAGGILGGASYLADSWVTGETATLAGFALNVGIGVVSANISGEGANKDKVITNAVNRVY